MVATATSLGVDLTQAARTELGTYRAMLAQRAEREGLMSARAVQGLDEHLIDALSVCRFVPRVAAPQTCIDVGSGAGLPGVAVAIGRPDLCVTLLDAGARRTRFLEDVAAALPDRGLTVVTARAEVAAHGALRESFDVALARAVASLASLVELALPFVRPGGQLLAMKTAGARDEIEAADCAIEACGGRLATCHEVSWPGLRMPRLIVEVGKARPTPPDLPRRDGLPQQRPLRPARS